MGSRLNGCVCTDPTLGYLPIIFFCVCSCSNYAVYVRISRNMISFVDGVWREYECVYFILCIAYGYCNFHRIHSLNMETNSSVFRVDARARLANIE